MSPRTRLAVVAATVLAAAGVTYQFGPVTCACNTPVYGDTTPPTVVLTAPTFGQTVSGTSVAISATAADNVGVAGVQFQLDGSNLQSEDTTFPYGITWDTTGSGDGPHDIRAIARDAAGNTTTSALATVTVSNGGGGGGFGVDVAQLWVDSSSGGSCTRVGGGQSYSHGASCSTFQAAYTASHSGDIIGVACSGAAACVYPDQTLSTDNTSLTSYVTFTPLAGVAPQLGCYTPLTANWLNGTDTTLHVASTSCFAGRLTALHLWADTANFTCTGITSTSWTGCTGGPGSAGDGWRAPAEIWENGTITDNVRYAEFDGISAEQLTASSTACNHLTFSDATLRFMSFAGPCNDVNVTNTTVGPNTGGHSSIFMTSCTSCTFDHDIFSSINGSGVQSQSHSQQHGENFFLRYANGLTISDSRFVNWGDYTIFLTPSGDPNTSWLAESVTLENNFFGCPNTTFSGMQTINNYSGATAQGLRNWTVDYNTFCSAGALITSNLAGGTSNIVMRGNYGAHGMAATCAVAGITYVFNVWTANACTGDSPTAALDVVDSSVLGANLTPNLTSGALAHGDPASCPPTDINETARPIPIGTTCDAGAAEVGVVGGTGGQSTAVCAGTCTQGTPVSHTITPTANAIDGTTNGQTYTYQVERPNNLTNSSTNLAPLVVVFSSPGADESTLQALSATDKYVLMYLAGTHNANYGAATTQSDTTTFGNFTCGSGSTKLCDDIPALKGILDRIVCSGASPCENIDPSKVYLAGASKGGGMVQDAICDTRTSSYVTAAVVVSNTLISQSTGNDQTAPSPCPALLGTSNGTGGAAGLTPNTNLSVLWMYGTNDGTYCAGVPSPAGSNCLDTGFVDGKNRWQFSGSQDAGQTSPTVLSPATNTGSNSGIGHHIGCSGTASVSNTISAHITENIFTGCTVSYRGAGYYRVATGGHSWGGLDGVDSFNSGLAAWNFFVAYGGP